MGRFFLTLSLGLLPLWAQAQNAVFSDTPPQNSVFSNSQPAAPAITNSIAPPAAPVAPAEPAANKAQIFEKDDTTKSFTAKVSTVREISGEVDVFFEGDAVHGGFMLPSNAKGYATMMTDLVNSQKTGGQDVSVTADDQQRILTVRPSGSSSKEAKKP